MTATEIREALRAIGDDVAVPGLDPTDFQGRVRQVRRRRTATRAGVAALAAVTVAAVTVGVTAQTMRSDRDLPATDHHGKVGVDVSWNNTDLVMQLRDGLVLVSPGDPPGLQEIDVSSARLLTESGPTVTYLDPDGMVRSAALNSRGDVISDDLGAEPRVYGPVVRAWAARGGGAVAYVDPDGATYVWSSTSDEPTRIALDTAPEVATVHVYGDSQVVFASAVGRTLTITPLGGDATTVEAAADITDIGMGGHTMSVQTTSGVEIRDLDGTLRHPATGTRGGALSDDGHWYASVGTRADWAAGPAPTVRMLNTTNGALEKFLVDSDGPVTGVWWRDEDHFFLMAGDRESQTLMTCTVSAWSCQRAYVNDQTGTMKLPQD